MQSPWIICECIYDEIRFLWCDRRVVRVADKYGYVNGLGNITIPIIYDIADDFRQDRAAVSLNGAWMYIDINGKPRIQSIYKLMPLFYTRFFGANGLVAVQKNGLWGAIDINGQIIVPFNFDFISRYYEGLAIAKTQGFWGVINELGETIIPFEYTHIDSCSEGLFGVTKNYCSGFHNRNNHLQVPLIYDKVKSFNKGLAPVCLQNLWGCINALNEIIVPCIYMEVECNFGEHSIIKVRNGNGYGYLDKLGKTIISVKYDEIDNFYSENFALAKFAGKYGYIDHSGNEYWEN